MAILQSGIRLIKESELVAAQRIVAAAFSEQLGLPDPDSFGNGATWIARYYQDPESIFVIEEDRELAGVSVAAAWGSFGFFGPICVAPKFWNRKLGQRLLEPVMDYFEKRSVRHAALFTFSSSVKHICLYQKYGFHPRSLTAICRKKIHADYKQQAVAYERLSTLSEPVKKERLDGIRQVTESLMAGLDLSNEIRVVLERKIGEVIVTMHPSNSKVNAFAIAHFGDGSEAERQGMYLKFAAAVTGSHQAESADAFAGMLQACQSVAGEEGLQSISAGVNAARTGAYRLMLDGGFLPLTFGVAMHRPNEAGFSDSQFYVIDDLR